MMVIILLPLLLLPLLLLLMMMMIRRLRQAICLSSREAICREKVKEKILVLMAIYM